MLSGPTPRGGPPGRLALRRPAVRRCRQWAISWGDEISRVSEVRRRRSSSSAAVWRDPRRDPAEQAGLPFAIIEKNEGPGGTWWENRYPGARVDVGSHQYCYSFEPADHWSEYYCQQPEFRDVLRGSRGQVRPPAPLPVRDHGHCADVGRGQRLLAGPAREADGAEDDPTPTSW